MSIVSKSDASDAPGFFGILKDKKCNFTVSAVHLSAWALKRRRTFKNFWQVAFLKTHDFYFEIGIRLKISCDELKELRVVLPAEIDEGSFFDLSKIVLDAEQNHLIFGRPVKVENHNITYDGTSIGEGEVKEHVVSAREINRSTVSGDDDTSCYTVKLSTPINNSNGVEQFYTRFRVRLSKPSEMWVSKGWGDLKRGLIVDTRISDIREAKRAKVWANKQEELLAIEKVNLFLILSARYCQIMSSPQPYYARLLEPNVWNDYLQDCQPFESRERLAIYQWRNGQDACRYMPQRKKDSTVTIDTPFRSMIHLQLDFGKEFLFWFVIIVILGSFVPSITFGVWRCVTSGWTIQDTESKGGGDVLELQGVTNESGALLPEDGPDIDNPSSDESQPEGINPDPQKVMTSAID